MEGSYTEPRRDRRMLLGGRSLTLGRFVHLGEYHAGGLSSIPHCTALHRTTHRGTVLRGWAGGAPSGYCRSHSGWAQQQAANSWPTEACVPVGVGVDVWCGVLG